MFLISENYFNLQKFHYGLYRFAFLYYADRIPINEILVRYITEIKLTQIVAFT